MYFVYVFPTPNMPIDIQMELKIKSYWKLHLIGVRYSLEAATSLKEEWDNKGFLGYMQIDLV